jgi:hypothetical protein
LPGECRCKVSEGQWPEKILVDVHIVRGGFVRKACESSRYFLGVDVVSMRMYICAFECSTVLATCVDCCMSFIYVVSECQRVRVVSVSIISQGVVINHYHYQVSELLLYYCTSRCCRR